MNDISSFRLPVGVRSAALWSVAPRDGFPVRGLSRDLRMAQQPVTVRDGVFSSVSCAALRNFSDASYRLDSGLRHYFLRGPEYRPVNPVEAAIDSFLAEIGDDAPAVEYWRRATWAHVAPHRDIDELVVRRGQFRYPINGHVLYTAVGGAVLGPTALLWEDDDRHAHLTTVPAVQGRVVRFNGTFLHAVPRPHDVRVRVS
jgi:hypothetical protein